MMNIKPRNFVAKNSRINRGGVHVTKKTYRRKDNKKIINEYLKEEK
jgi:hypothetical protein